MDPPGHTVFLYLRELNRSELQKQAKLYGIKANQKSQVLRQRLQEVLTARNSVSNSPQSVAVVKNEQQKINVPTEEKQKESVLEDNNKNDDAPNSLNELQVFELDEVVHVQVEAQGKDDSLEELTDASIVAQPKQEDLRAEPDTESVWIEVDEDDENEEFEKDKNVIRSDTENEENTNVPPQVVIVDLDSAEMVDLANESLVSPTTAMKKTNFRSKIPTSSSGGAFVRRKVFGERTLNSASNCKPSKLGKPPKQQFQLNKIGVANVIRNKNAPLRQHPPSCVTRKPVLVTKTNPRPKQMPMSRRNELQYQKFLERQIRGRKNRQEELKRAEFTSFVR